MNTLIIVAICVTVVAEAMPATMPKIVTPQDMMFEAVVERAERAINDANKNDLYLMKVTRVHSVEMTLDSPASKVYDVEFEAAHTDSPKGTDPNSVDVPSVSFSSSLITRRFSHVSIPSFRPVIQNAPISVCNVKLAFHPWLIHTVPVVTVVKAVCHPK